MTIFGEKSQNFIEGGGGGGGGGGGRGGGGGFGDGGLPPGFRAQEVRQTIVLLSNYFPIVFDLNHVYQYVAVFEVCEVYSCLY